MAIPTILLAIALITLTRPGLGIVIVAIVIPEVPRIVRVVRATDIANRAGLSLKAAEKESGQKFDHGAIAVPARSWRLRQPKDEMVPRRLWS